MTGFADDDTLLAGLRDAVTDADPVPAHVLAGARAAFTLRTLDAELAALTADSADEPEGLIAVRGGGDVRLISFETGPVAVELQVTDRGAVRDLVAQISGTEVRIVEVETPQGRRPADVLDGMVIAEGVTGGLVRLRMTAPDGHALVTSWVRI